MVTIVAEGHYRVAPLLLFICAERLPSVPTLQDNGEYSGQTILRLAKYMSLIIRVFRIANKMSAQFLGSYIFCVSLGLLLLGQTPASAVEATDPSIAFYYGGSPPAEALSQFDRIVVRATAITPAELALLRGHRGEVYAYVSASEVSQQQAQASDIHFRLGQNPARDTVIMDAANPGWRRLLLEQTLAPLWERGFHSFFLDHLDSYQRAVRTPAQGAAQVHGLVQLVRELHARFPGAKLLINRGFELLPEVSTLVVGVVAESLFQGWDPVTQRYVQVTEQDRSALLARLRAARDQSHLPITVIDYVPHEERERARATARSIAALGLTPWVSDHALRSLGVGTLEPIPRRILALYNSAEQRESGSSTDVAYTPVHQHAAVVLEYLGYAIDYVDVQGSLPSGALRDKYAGIVTWFTDEHVPNEAGYRSWLLGQLEAGLRVAVLDKLGFSLDTRLQQRLGLILDEPPELSPVKLRLVDAATIGFETKIKVSRKAFFPQRLAHPAARPLLSLEDQSGARMDAVFTTWWGGMATYPYVLEEGVDFDYRWIINPFVFFQRALQLPDLPAADVTTQDGHRMLIVHIDGDGFPSRAEMPGTNFCSKVILEQILKHYPVKFTVSIVEGEIGPTGKWPKLSPKLEAIARDIFALPNVEVASHSYSHPFDWLRYGHDMEDGDINGMFRFNYSLKREVDDSVAYINNRLAPRDKPTKVYLWSGEAIASLEVMALVHSAGLLNMNGGDTILSSRKPTLTVASAMGRPIGPYYQVYAPIQNENIYTNEWKGPFYGFREVISTFELTEMPRRLKPINIYFHFYSGSKIGSLKALKQVFDYALAQDVVSVYASEYIRKVEDFQRLSFARRLDGCLQLNGDGKLTTLRIDPGSALGAVDLARSRGVTSVRELPQGRFIGLDDSGRAALCLGSPAGQVAGQEGAGHVGRR